MSLFLEKMRKDRTPRFGFWANKRSLEDSIGINSGKLRQIIRKAKLPSDRWPISVGKKRFLVNSLKRWNNLYSAFASTAEVGSSKINTWAFLKKAA